MTTPSTTIYSMTYLECPKCQKKFHPNAVACPRCKVTPEAYHASVRRESREKAYAELRRDEAKRHLQLVKAKRALGHTCYCTTCGTTFDKRQAVSLVRGSFLLEVILWLCFLLPGLAYSIYRNGTRGKHHGKGKGCPACRSCSIIPATSPMAKQAMAIRHR
jgi:hypothetical protein